MSTVDKLLEQKMALERKIEAARILDIERQKRLEAEILAKREEEILSLRESVKLLLRKYDLTENEFLYSTPSNVRQIKVKSTDKKPLTLSQMRMYYSGGQ